jgi:thioredoxin
MAAISEITDHSFQTELAGPGPVLVDFWAPWCGPCRMVAPVVEAVARKYQGRLKVAKVNVDDNPLLATKFNIMGIPTLALFKDGRLVDQIVGAAPQAQVEKAIEGVLAS